MRLLLLDSDADTRESVVKLLGAWDHDVTAATGLEQALELARSREFDIILLDLASAPSVDGLLQLLPDVPIVAMATAGTVRGAVDALRAGVFDYVVKPLDPDELRHAVGNAAERVRLTRENRVLRSELTNLLKQGDTVPTNDPRMKSVLRQADRAAASDATILLTGESGTGKELMARYIQQRSPRADRPFLAVNCSALSGQVLESELFGHVRGAFTDAHRDRTGYFEEADGGTLFLDEIGDMGLQLQVKLLRVLQERQFSRVGETRSRRSDLRIISATNQDLEELVGRGTMREDFFYRVNAFRIHVPPLRERPGDIMFLFARFVHETAASIGKGPAPGQRKRIDPDVRAALEGSAWPGNVRQLRNVAQSMTITAQGADLGPEHLPEELRRQSRPSVPVGESTDAGPPPAPSSLLDSDFRESRRCFEVEYLTRHLKHNHGNVAATARHIGMHPVSLSRKITHLGIDVAAIRRDRL